jgi:hypothetical protein
MRSASAKASARVDDVWKVPESIPLTKFPLARFSVPGGLKCRPTTHCLVDCLHLLCRPERVRGIWLHRDDDSNHCAGRFVEVRETGETIGSDAHAEGGHGRHLLVDVPFGYGDHVVAWRFLAERVCSATGHFGAWVPHDTFGRHTGGIFTRAAIAWAQRQRGDMFVPSNAAPRVRGQAVTSPLRPHFNRPFL